MKKIIKGKLYDTATARELGAWDNGADGIDECVEALYQKRTGEYFLHGAGGARTRYAKEVEHGWSGGERIMPLTYDEARKWAEAHLEADEYAEIFGMPSEDAEDVTLHVRIPAVVDARLRAMASARGTSMAAVVIEALREAVK